MLKHFKIILLLFLGFLFSDCATLVNGSSQKILIASEPLGATVYVDSLWVGVTPLNVDLSRKENHRVHIEMLGYEKYFGEINSSINSNPFLFSIGNFLLGTPVSLFGYVVVILISSFLSPEDSVDNTTENIVLLLSSIAPFFVDFYYGGMKELKPEIINVSLQKSEAATLENNKNSKVEN